MRLQHIDIARGLCILMVAFGHNTVLAPAFSQALGTFRMPLMFFIAGTFFNTRQPLKDLALNKADALLKPFFVMALLHAPFRLSLWHADPVSYGLGMLSGSGTYLPWIYALWFLPHLWLLFVCLWVFNAAATRLDLKPMETLMASGFLMITGLLILPYFWMQTVQILGFDVQLKGLPFSADLLPISGFFFTCGMIARKHVHQLTFRWPALLLATSLSTYIIVQYQPEVSLFDRRYLHPLACTVAGLTGSMAVIELAAFLTRWLRLAHGLAMCGVNSLFILMFHSPIQTTSRNLLDKLWGSGSLLSASLAFVICVMSSLILAQTIRRYSWLSLLFLPAKQVRAGKHKALVGETTLEESAIKEEPIMRRAA